MLGEWRRWAEAEEDQEVGGLGHWLFRKVLGNAEPAPALVVFPFLGVEARL